MTKSQRPQVFIEKIIPVKLLNEQVYYEHGGNPFKGLHRWYSRKPLSFSRASVLASLLPADISMEEFEYLLGLHPEKDGILVKKKEAIKLYKTPPTSRIIEKLEEYCEKVWGKRKPVVLDAFAGNGSIPFEAARYGLNVFASDLNPVAVTIMKAVMQYPLKFGSDLQQDLDKWVRWIGNRAEKQLAEFFPSNKTEKTIHYLWAHTVICPNCEFVIPLSPNWWLYRRTEKQNLHKWCAVKPVLNLDRKIVEFELVKGAKGKGTTIQTKDDDYDPNSMTTMSKGVGKCINPNCGCVIEENIIKSQANSFGLGHQLYAVAIHEEKGSLQFRIPNDLDLEGIYKAEKFLGEKQEKLSNSSLFLKEERFNGYADRCIAYGLNKQSDYFNPRQLLALSTYMEIVNEAISKIKFECEPEKVEAISVYLTLILDRCVDKNCRLSHLDAVTGSVKPAMGQHSLNLFWNYPEISIWGLSWNYEGRKTISDYSKLCSYFSLKSDSIIPGLEQYDAKSIQIDSASADSLFHIPDNSVDTIVTDPPYYSTLQ
jgi:putative DNA methylase